MTMTNAEWMQRNGIQFKNLGYKSGFDPEYEVVGYYDKNGHFNECYKGKINGNSISEIILTWLDMEHVEPILDDAERQYLSAVVKPFRCKIKGIEKQRNWSNSSERIYFHVKKGDMFYLLDFKLGTMYKGMKLNRKYTLEELGL